mgnify:CR=1 FL=1
MSFLSYPTASPVVTSSYGMRFHPVLNYSRLHAGTVTHRPRHLHSRSAELPVAYAIDG